MCGICGIYNENDIDSKDLRRMAAAISHRGPDDDGFYENGRVGLGMRRLSIIDLAGGHQPISNEDNSIWIVFNGEIYNYQALHKELVLKGHEFRTSSDTEVILHLYEDYGENCLNYLNGMFGFAIWDSRQNQLFLARDRLGQKPIFYALHDGRFFFASEIKAILATGLIPREIDYQAVHHYLSLRFIPPPLTMLRAIKKLPPAHYLIFKDGEVRTERYWELSFHEKLNLSEDELIDGLRDKLRGAVKLHMVSDVPVGAFLSGGMDSSTIVAMMAKIATKPPKTFSIGVSEQDFNELPYARMVAEYYNTDHVEKYVESNLIRMLPRIVYHMDEPSDPIAACVYHAAELAAQHVKVVMGGDGGDELFAGFDRYKGVGYIDRYTMIPALLRSKLIGPVLNALPDSYTYKSITQKLRWMHQIAELSSLGERYAEATLFFRFNQEDKKLLFSDSLWRQVGAINSANVIVEQFEHANAEDPLDRMLYADIMTRLPEHSLMLTDRMTMAHSLEARSPFLDHTLVEYMASYPSNMKIRNGELKYALRKLAVEFLPDQIVNRDKQGFMFPIAYWFKNDLYNFLKRFMMDSIFVKEGIFKRERVMHLIDEHRSNKMDHHVRLWMLLNLQIWFMLYIDQCTVEEVEERMLTYL